MKYFVNNYRKRVPNNIPPSILSFLKANYKLSTCVISQYVRPTHATHTVQSPKPSIAVIDRRSKMFKENMTIKPLHLQLPVSTLLGYPGLSPSPGLWFVRILLTATNRRHPAASNP